MPRDSHAQFFIQTLAEMLEVHREKRSLRLRRQFKAHAEHFMQTYQNDCDGALRPSVQALYRRQTDLASAGGGRGG